MSVSAPSESDSGIASYIRNFAIGIVALTVVGLIISALSRAAIDDSASQETWDTTVKTIAFGDTNLSQFGIPNFEGAEPYKSKYLNKIDQVEGFETRKDYYKIDDFMINVYTIGDELFFVRIDRDWKLPLDLALIDLDGNGQFSDYGINRSTAVPSWLEEKLSNK